MGNSDDDYTNPSRNPDVRELNETVNKLQSQIMTLSLTVNSLSTMDTIGNVLGQGFKMLDCHLGPKGTIPAQLAELRDLAPQRVPIPADAAQTITTVLAAMERPAFSGGGSLGIPQANVSFIGEGQATQPPPPVSTKPFPELVKLLRPSAGAQQPVASSNPQIVGGEIKS